MTREKKDYHSTTRRQFTVRALMGATAVAAGIMGVEEYVRRRNLPKKEDYLGAYGVNWAQESNGRAIIVIGGQPHPTSRPPEPVSNPVKTLWVRNDAVIVQFHDGFEAILPLQIKRSDGPAQVISIMLENGVGQGTEIKLDDTQMAHPIMLELESYADGTRPIHCRLDASRAFQPETRVRLWRMAEMLRKETREIEVHVAGVSPQKPLKVLSQPLLEKDPDQTRTEHVMTRPGLVTSSDRTR